MFLATSWIYFESPERLFSASQSSKAQTGRRDAPHLLPHTLNKKLSQRLLRFISLAIEMILESLISNLCFRWACQAGKWKVKTLKSKFETSSNNEAAEFNKKVTDSISWKSSVSRTVPEYLKYSSVSTSRPSSESGFLFFSDLVLCK